MSKNVIVLCVLFVLLSSCLIMANPVVGTTMSAMTENSWVSKAPMHIARSDLGIATVNGKIYAIGGQVLVYQDAQRTESKDVGITEEYDPSTNTWTAKTPMPIPSNGFATAVYQNNIYCLGAGINEVYNPATDKWENETSLPVPIAQANVVDSKIYVIGGYPNNTLNAAYDPATEMWMTKAPMPKAGGGVASAVLAGKIYFFGGDFDNGYVSLTEIYNPETDTWSFGTGAPTYFLTGVAVATSGVMAPKQIYVFNFPYADLASMHAPFFTTQVYNPKNDSWSAGADIPTNRQDFGVATVNDTIYVIGGFSLKYPNMLSVYQSPAITYYATNEQYIPFGYGTVPPVVSVASPETKNYTSSEIPLNFTMNKPVDWIRYSLDGKDNITISGNTTLSGLPIGKHNVTVYAQDSFGNVGESETINFTMAMTDSFPTAVLLAASVGVSVAIVVVGLIYYSKKRRHNPQLIPRVSF